MSSFNSLFGFTLEFQRYEHVRVARVPVCSCLFVSMFFAVYFIPRHFL